MHKANAMGGVPQRLKPILTLGRLTARLEAAPFQIEWEVE